MDKKTLAAITAAGLILGAASFPAYASISTVDVYVDVENISGWTPGVSFFPDIDLEDEDSDELTLSVDISDIENAMDPTHPVTINFTLESEDEILDEDLEVRGNAIRTATVDAADTQNASGRFLVYPFYQLPEPEAVIDTDEGILSWKAVDFAGKYEIVITYCTDGGSEKTVHFKEEDTEKDISSYIKYAENGLGAAVRALATDDEYFSARVDYDDKEASWESVPGVEEYKVSITYTNSRGTELKKTREVTGNTLDVASYINASDDGTITVKVRALPSSDESKYYNIAPSEWNEAGGSTYSPDISDYEVDYVWDLLGDYTSVTDGVISSVSRKTAAFGSFASSGSGTGSDESWVRTGYKWQYLKDGVPYSAGWLLIDDAWYYFDSDGYMHTGWLYDGGNYYYLTSVIGAACGQMVTGTQEIYGKTYIFGADGACTNR